MTYEFNSPMSQKDWDKITDAELKDTDEIIFTTPSEKKKLFRKVKHGKWINPEMGYEECSACGYCFANYDEHDYQIERNFCPNCGADMRERKESE